MGAKAARARDVGAKNSSDEVDPEIVSKILNAAAVSQHIEATWQRRVEQLRMRSISAYSAACNVPLARENAISEMEGIASAVVVQDFSGVTTLTKIDPELIVWSPVAMKVVREAWLAEKPRRTRYQEGGEILYRQDGIPVEVSQLDAAFDDWRAQIEGLKRNARERASALAAAT